MSCNRYTKPDDVRNHLFPFLEKHKNV